MSPTGHFSSASGRTVWFVKKNVLQTISHALSHGTSSSSTSMRMSSGIASVGCVYRCTCLCISSYFQSMERGGGGTHVVQLDRNIWVDAISVRHEAREVGRERECSHSGNSVMSLPMFLNRRMMSARLAAVQKYFCFRRSSFPTENARTRQRLPKSGSNRKHSQVVWSFGYSTDVIASALFDASTARS